MKRLVLFPLIVLAGLGAAAAAARQEKAPAEAPPIRNFVRVSEEFCTGGQPKLEHLAALKEQGVKAVINLRRPSEHRADEEEAEAKRLGLRYFNIPFSFGEPKDEQATEFLKLTDDPANRPAFIHCAAAVRAGAFWMIRRVLRDGWSVEDAEREAEKIGLREAPHLNEFARAYIEKHRKK
ncbi:MAG TPA: protein tyrosine phosphatase family protein [Pyrinomonadaceae bacterium]|nr:protein tyrosine phosphatase family protein [Pyrinomonadaceae bacterium]